LSGFVIALTALWSCHYERSEESALVSVGTIAEKTAAPFLSDPAFY
jgi:hypothetical protein